MVTTRAYLVSKNLAKPTRGRLSRDAKAELARVRAEGMTFDDDPAPTPFVSDVKAKGTDVPSEGQEAASEAPQKAHDHGANPAHISPITTEKFMTFEAPVGRVPTSTACHNCGYSFSYKDCGDNAVLDWRTDKVCRQV